MKVTDSNYPVFTTNVHHTKISGLGTDSTKRLMRHCDSQFSDKRKDKDKREFDDRARDVLVKYELNSGEVEAEVKYLDSVGYGGVFSSEQLIQQMQKFQSYHVPRFTWNRNYQRAVKQVLEMTLPRISKLHILNYRSDGDIKDALPKANAHSGFEFIVTGLKQKGMYMEGALDHFKKELTEARRNGTFGKPILTLHRLQCSGAYDDDGQRTGQCKHKTRLVSAVDIWVVIAELMWAKPFQRHLGCLDYYASGKKQWQLRTNIQHYRNQFKQWSSLDYSKFDQSIPSWLIRDAFEIIWQCFDGCEDWRWLWDIIVNDFINKSFIGPEGRLYYAQDGVPSGSMFTQIIDTICNLIMIHTYFNSMEERGNRDDYHCIICGDDNFITHNKSLNFEDLEGYLQRNFGVECNASKCATGTQGDDPKFLSRTWRVTGEWRQPKELIGKLLYPERFRPYNSNEQLTPEMIVYSYILAFRLGMEELIDVEAFLKDNQHYLKSWSTAIFEYQSGYLSYLMRYENP